mmetsp:Transcript_5110/g.18273  ORF Transcript_5110/g.18273 Transcript_5110/m.18273 type:complete len:243 (-) Transcript_5110:693-1421(-)
MPRGRDGEHRAAQVVLHELQQRRVPREVIPRRLERREDELQPERARALGVLVRVALERDERDAEAEDLQDAHQTERLPGGPSVELRVVPAEVGALALGIRRVPSGVCGRPRRGVRRRAGALLRRRRGRGRLPLRERRRRRRLFRRRRRRFPFDVMRSPRRRHRAVLARVARAQAVHLRQPFKHGVHDLAKDVPGQVPHQRGLLPGLVPYAVARLHDVADVVVAQKPPGRARHALEEDVEDLG